MTGIELLLRSSQIAPRAKIFRRSRQGTKTANTPAVNPGEKAIHTERRRRVFAAMTKQLAGAGVRDPSSLRHFSILPRFSRRAIRVAGRGHGRGAARARARETGKYA